MKSGVLHVFNYRARLLEDIKLQLHEGGETLGVINKDLINSLLIPLGVIFGSAIGVILSIFFEPISQGLSIAMGAGIGLLLGSIAYGFYKSERVELQLLSAIVEQHR